MKINPRQKFTVGNLFMATITLNSDWDYVKRHLDRNSLNCT